MDGLKSVIISLVCNLRHTHDTCPRCQTSPTVDGHKSQFLHSSTLQVNLQVEENIVCCTANFYIASEQRNPSCVMESQSVW